MAIASMEPERITSYTVTMFGWFRAEAACASRMKRSEPEALAVCCDHFQGDFAIQVGVVGRIDLPIPPWPTKPVMTKRPTAVPVRQTVGERTAAGGGGTGRFGKASASASSLHLIQHRQHFAGDFRIRGDRLDIFASAPVRREGAAAS